MAAQPTQQRPLHIKRQIHPIRKSEGMNYLPVILSIDVLHMYTHTHIANPFKLFIMSSPLTLTLKKSCHHFLSFLLLFLQIKNNVNISIFLNLPLFIEDGYLNRSRLAESPSFPNTHIICSKKNVRF